MTAPANQNNSPLLRPTLEKLARFDKAASAWACRATITVHLDAGYDNGKTRDLLEELDCHGVISVKGIPLQAGRPLGHRTDQIHGTTAASRNWPDLHRTKQARSIDAFIALANAVIITRRLHPRRLDHPPLGHPPHPTTMTYPRDL